LWLEGQGAGNAFMMAGFSALLGSFIMIFVKNK